MNVERPSKIKLFIPGDKTATPGKPGVPNKITHGQMLQWLQKAEIDEYTKDKLIKMVKRYPSNTMSHFYENLHKHIARIRKERKENPEK